MQAVRKPVLFIASTPELLAGSGQIPCWRENKQGWQGSPHSFCLLRGGGRGLPEMTTNQKATMTTYTFNGKEIIYDSRYWESKETTILERVCEKLKDIGGPPISVSEALRFRGVGRKTLDELIRRGYVIGTLSDPESRKKRRAEQIAETAARLKRARTQKVRKMLMDTELRLKLLKKELRELTA